MAADNNDLLRDVVVWSLVDLGEGQRGPAAPPFVGACPRTPLGYCAYGVSFRSRCNCYGPLFLNFLDLPLVVDEIQPNLKFVNPNPKN